MRGVHELGEIAERPVLNRAAGDDDVLEPVLAGQFAGVAGVFVVGCRLGIRVRDGRAAQRHRDGDGIVGEQAETAEFVEGERGGEGRAEAQFRSARILGFLRLFLRDLPILAVEAAQHAAGRCEGEGRAAGEKMKQGLLLHRIDVKRARVAVDHRVQGAVLVDLVAAMAAIAGREQTVVRTDLALDVAVELEVVRSLLDPAALLPECPQRRIRGVALEDIRRRLGGAQAKKTVHPGTGAAQAQSGESGGPARQRATAVHQEAVRCLIHPHRSRAR